MKKKRFSVEQITAVLQQAEGGVPVGDVCRQVGISEQTYYRWKKAYGGMPPSEARELKQLRDENAKLKRLVADLSHECLNVHWFGSLEDAQQKIDAFRWDYNEHHPHRALKGLSRGTMTPAFLWIINESDPPARRFCLDSDGKRQEGDKNPLKPGGVDDMQSFVNQPVVITTEDGNA